MLAGPAVCGGDSYDTPRGSRSQLRPSPRWFFARRSAFCLGLWRSLFHYSDTWQLVINTGTTIVTFLMVFLLQNTQYRDTRAIQLKLDGLIRASAKLRQRGRGFVDRGLIV
jgi:low affinity Fe/Cu permease